MIIVSTGFYRTHMTVAASAASARGKLALAITGAYPVASLTRVLSALRLTERGRIARLLERAEAIPDPRVVSLFVPELLDELARLIVRVPLVRHLYPRLGVACMRLYGWLASRALSQAGSAGDVFHFRAAFGHSSIDTARDRGIVSLCDHAAVHPAVVDQLLASSGDIDAAIAQAGSEPSHPLWRAMLSDIQRADGLVVNSMFLKEMFVRLGYPEDRVWTVYLGVDDGFLSEVADLPSPAVRASLQLMFAGRFERAKGAEILIDALRQVNEVDWELAIAGPVDRRVASAFPNFFADPRVTSLGTINRKDLARRMKGTAVFVFPSFAEGSARVVFEAMACGCYVITTPNSGSVVEQGVHGALVAPGSREELAAAIHRASSDRARVAEIGARNAKLVAERFRQSEYGAALAAVYREVARAHRGRVVAAAADVLHGHS